MCSQRALAAGQPALHDEVVIGPRIEQGDRRRAVTVVLGIAEQAQLYDLPSRQRDLQAIDIGIYDDVAGRLRGHRRRAAGRVCAALGRAAASRGRRHVTHCGHLVDRRLLRDDRSRRRLVAGLVVLPGLVDKEADHADQRDQDEAAIFHRRDRAGDGLGNRVHAAGIQGVAACDSGGGQTTAAQRPVTPQGLGRVLRTAGIEAAARRQQTADRTLIQMDQGNQDPRHRVRDAAAFCAAILGHRRSIRVHSCSTSARRRRLSASRAGGFAVITMSQGARRSQRCLNTSRTMRLTRLR
jgi:hypothetical protein